MHLVALGDSIPFAGHFCPGCTGFVAQYGSFLQKRTGRPVLVSNRSRDDGAQMQDIEIQLTSDANLRAKLAAADVVLASVGFNDMLPNWGVGCPGDMGSDAAGYIAWALTTTPECLTPMYDHFAAEYDTIFSAITDLRAGKPTLFAVINLHDANLGGADIVNANVTKDALAGMARWMIAQYDRWNAMECTKAKQHRLECIDVYHAFNGPEGDQVAGANVIDGVHPSQAGHDVITALLAKLDTKAIAP